MTMYNIRTCDAARTEPCGYTIGIDIGGTNAKAGLIAMQSIDISQRSCAIKDNEIVYKTKIPSDINGSEKALFDRIFTLVEDILEKNKLKIEQITGIGIGVAGMVLAEKGILLSASNLKLEKIDVVRGVQKKYNMPVKIKNDLSMFALAEALISGVENLVFVAIGTGLNIGVITNGKLFEGVDGASLEYGQTALWDATVETYLSGPGFAKFGQQKMLEALSVVLVNLSNTYRPQKIVLGGGVSESITPEILSQLKKRFKEQNYGYKNAPEVMLEISSLAYDGAILGTAALYRESV